MGISSPARRLQNHGKSITVPGERVTRAARSAAGHLVVGASDLVDMHPRDAPDPPANASTIRATVDDHLNALHLYLGCASVGRSPGPAATGGSHCLERRAIIRATGPSSESHRNKGGSYGCQGRGVGEAV